MVDQSINNLTPRAQKVLALARKKADQFRHNFVGTEHLLLGLIRLGEGVAVNVLQKLGLNLETVRLEVEEQVGTGPYQKSVGPIPFTLRLDKVLSLAVQEAKALYHSHVGTEHLLLGLLRVGEGVAFKVLKDQRVEIERFREEVLKELDKNYRTPGLTSEGGVAHRVTGISPVNEVVANFLVVGDTTEMPNVLFGYLKLLLVSDFTGYDLINVPMVMVWIGIARDVEDLKSVCAVLRKHPRKDVFVRICQDLYDISCVGSDNEARFGRLLQLLTGECPRKRGPTIDWLSKPWPSVEEGRGATSPEKTGESPTPLAPKPTPSPGDEGYDCSPHGGPEPDPHRK